MLRYGEHCNSIELSGIYVGQCTLSQGVSTALTGIHWNSKSKTDVTYLELFYTTLSFPTGLVTEIELKKRFQKHICVEQDEYMVCCAGHEQMQNKCVKHTKVRVTNVLTRCKVWKWRRSHLQNYCITFNRSPGTGDGISLLKDHRKVSFVVIKMSFGSHLSTK